MRREEISTAVGNIRDLYIQEAADYSKSVCKSRAVRISLPFKRARYWFRSENRLLLKLGAALICILLITCSMAQLAIRKSDITNPNETAYKPAIMYESNLYLISSQNPDSFEIDESELICIGTIEDRIAGTSLPTENFQSSGNDDLLGCNIYMVEKYPENIFVYDPGGNLFVYELND